MSSFNIEFNKITPSEKEFFESNFGVKISRDQNNKIVVSGESAKNIRSVKSSINRLDFLEKNKENIPNFKSKEGSVSSKLSDYKYNERKNYKTQKATQHRAMTFSL